MMMRYKKVGSQFKFLIHYENLVYSQLSYRAYYSTTKNRDQTANEINDHWIKIWNDI